MAIERDRFDEVTPAPAAQPTPAEVARHHVRVYRCPGYAVNGSIHGCHPDAEPGSYDVMMGMAGINQTPMTLAEANELCSSLRHWIAYVVEHDRKGTPTKQSQIAPEHYTADMFDVTEAPGTGVWAVLRHMSAGSGRLIFARNTAKGPRFEVQNAPSICVAWDSLMYMERCGWVERARGTDRKTGPRVLTALGRRWGETAAETEQK